MIALDTNILIRYLTQDDEIQAEVVNKYIETLIRDDEQFLINNIVVCEVVWVLERCYHYKREQIALALRGIFSATEFVFEDPEVLWLSLEDYEIDKIDFSDSLIGNINRKLGCTHTITFDKRASKLATFKELS